MTNTVTSASILRAQVLAKSVAHSVSDAEKTIATNKEIKKREEAAEVERCQNRARARYNRNEELIKVDEDRIFGTDAAVKKAYACIAALKKARYAHFAASQVTDRRLLLRQERLGHLASGGCSSSPPSPYSLDERPGTVAGHDAVHYALEKERRGLIYARDRLLAMEQCGKQVIEELEAVRGFLSQDAAKRRHAVEQDRSYIISFGSVTVSGSSEEPPEIDEDGVLEIQETQRHVASLEARVEQICEDSDFIMKRFQAEYEEIHAQIEELLALSTQSLGDLGRRLKGQAKEVDGTTRMAERSLGEIKKKNLTKGDREGAKKVSALEGLVADLRVTRDALQEDIRNKAVLLDIDERCRKVTSTLETLFADRAERTSPQHQRSTFSSPFGSPKKTSQQRSTSSLPPPSFSLERKEHPSPLGSPTKKGLQPSLRSTGTMKLLEPVDKKTSQHRSAPALKTCGQFAVAH